MSSVMPIPKDLLAYTATYKRHNGTVDIFGKPGHTDQFEMKNVYIKRNLESTGKASGEFVLNYKYKVVYDNVNSSGLSITLNSESIDDLISIDGIDYKIIAIDTVACKGLIHRYNIYVQ